jgi:dolichyl-phosphate-mannose--protein O-mannosyl transferase
VYHYFPCTVFLALALAYMFGNLRGKAGRGAKLLAPAFAGLCLLLFAVFYPCLPALGSARLIRIRCCAWFGGQWPF